jgi:hypothetical protein
MATASDTLVTPTEQTTRLALLRFANELENDHLYVRTATLAVMGLNEDNDRGDDECGVLQPLDMLAHRLRDRCQQINDIRCAEAGA